MRTISNVKQVLKTSAAGVSALAILTLPAGALAHGGGDNGRSNENNSRNQSRNDGNRDDKRYGNRGDQQSNAKPAVAADQQRGDNRQDNKNWWDPKDCNERQAALNWRAADAQAKYTRQVTGLNIMLSGVQTYHASGAVTINNYDELNNKAVASQTNASNAVGAITAPQLDCGNTTEDNKSKMGNTW